jgi:hypothetical protein
MTTITIPQKMSGTGTIHDVESQHHAREIKFKRGEQYAVVLADYYGGKGYTTHRTAAAAVKQSNKEREFSHQIVDRNGRWYYCDGYELIPM